MPWTDLTPQQAFAALQQDKTLAVLDVRTPPEYESHHIEGASLIPVQVLDQYFTELDPKRAWLVVCEHGRRSVAACEFLAQQGFANLSNVTGGMAEWVAGGLPIGRGLPQQQAPQAGGCGKSHCGCAEQSAPAAEPLPRARMESSSTGGFGARFLRGIRSIFHSR